MFGHWHLQCDFLNTAKAFTYKVWFPELGLRYIGVKAMNGNRWKKYTTSSKYVNRYLADGYRAVFTIVEFFETYADAHNKEQEVIRAYTAVQRREYLNANLGGAIYFTPEVRKLMSERGKGRVVSAETCAKLSKINKGRVVTDEQRKNIKLAAIEREKRYTPEQRAAANRKRSETQKGISKPRQTPFTPESMAKVRSNAKLTLDEVYNIRFVDEGSLAELAAKYNASKPTICRVKNYKIFKEITKEWRKQ